MCIRDSIWTEFTDFDDYWLPFLGGQGPAPSYTTVSYTHLDVYKRQMANPATIGDVRGDGRRRPHADRRSAGGCGGGGDTLAGRSGVSEQWSVISKTGKRLTQRTPRAPREILLGALGVFVIFA